MVEKLPKNLLENLAPGENVIDALKTRSIASKPDYTVLTDRRILYFNEKFLGRYELKVIPYQKLEEMKAERGRVRYGSIAFKDEDGEVVSLNRVSKEYLEPFVDSLEKALNDVAVEPVSIERKKGLMGKMEWRFLKPAEMVFVAKPTQRQQETRAARPLDPLEALKMRFVNGEITEEEYLRKKKLLE